MIRLACAVALVSLAGCGALPFVQQRVEDAPAAPAPRPAVAEAPRASAPSVVAPPARVTASAAALDASSPAERAAARAQAQAAAPAARDLGRVTATLGDPAEQGLWLKTDLVEAETPGLVTTASGASASLTLRPLGGAGGAQLSLAALRTLDLSLAGIHEVTVARAP
jgi:hypothetical protein